MLNFRYLSNIQEEMSVTDTSSAPKKDPEIVFGINQILEVVASSDSGLLRE